ncbi:LOW QUALITY PROTEIN: U-box domain-containing protein 3-like [Primulina eburnea]|uniref:LOW QUALITY PROTEIN: U-box domain-containing protein 3-like n=1 Tax=Primulina eburnea TaxID=1245227 RepID=UPI003C6C2B30
MDLTLLRSLVNSISRFIHLVTCCMSKAMPVEKEYQNIVSFLKHLKAVLDGVADCRLPLDEALSKECEELDFAVNEARIFLEKWSTKTSKILCVIECKPLFIRIQNSSVKLSCLLCKLSESSPTTLSLSRAQFCMQESQNLNLGKLSQDIEEIFKRQIEGKNFDSKHLTVVVESLNLRSNQELLSEHIALEKERQKAEDNRTNRNLDDISLAVDLMNQIHDFTVAKLENTPAINGIRIPSYFRCPLSLELMSDPVIVSSGQTYDRVAIQKWLDHGLVTCPKTRHKLSHNSLIPNYTVKALIENWCRENKVKLSRNPSDILSVGIFPERISQEDDLPCSTSISSSGFEEKKIGVSNGLDVDGNGVCIKEADKFDRSPPEHSYVHSRSESTSSAISSVESLPTGSSEISRISSKQDGVSDRSGDVTSSYPSFSFSNKISGVSSFSGKQYHSAKAMDEMATNRNHNSFRTLSFSSTSGSNDLTTTSHVEKLIKDLKSESTELQTAAAGELRFLAKYNVENRFIIVQCGAIAPLIALLHSDMNLAQEHAVTALLNLSINENLKAKIAEEGALEPFIHVLKNGNPVAKENAAAALFSLSLLDEYRIKIGRSSAIRALVDLLGSGTVRGKKDAATALFNLSIFHENKARIVQANAVKHLVVLMDPSTEMVDKAVALLANLSTIAEGCSAIAREGGIPLLVEIVDMGSQRGKENAASVLMQLCINSPKYCRIVLQEGAVPPLVALTQSGTPRAREKAQQLLSHFRNQRESTMARGRSRKET